MSETPVDDANPAFSSADITALSHLYRGEVYRSTVWRTRLDATTNWAVLTTGIALSLTFSSESASPLPLVVVGLLDTAIIVDAAETPLRLQKLDGPEGSFKQSGGGVVEIRGTCSIRMTCSKPCARRRTSMRR